MSGRSVRGAVALLAGVWLSCPAAQGAAFLQGAYYRLGEADPGAAPGSVGNDPTLDSFSNHLDLTRQGVPAYSSDVSPFTVDSKLSMRFANDPVVVSGQRSAYGRTGPLDMGQQGYAIEMWAKSANSAADSPAASRLIAYNGTPGTDGFGAYQSGGSFVVRIGSAQTVLGAADGKWHHLAFVHTFSTHDYYYDGKLVLETTTDVPPVSATGGFWMGGLWMGGSGSGTTVSDAFDGWIDEVRYLTFNPLSDGAFAPTSFLIAPEPGTGLLGCAGALLLLKRRRKARWAGRHEPGAMTRPQ